VSHPVGIAHAEAVAILERVAAGARMPVEATSLTRALGAVLAEDLVSGLDLPGFDNSAMDGFAARGADLADGAALALVGEQFAGALPWPGRIEPGQALRITTGALLPAGADTVVIKENCQLEGARVRVLRAPPPGANIRRAGEDVRRGQRLLQAGEVLAPASLGLAAAVGEDRLRVHRRPTVALFTTGDELQPPGNPLGPGQIYDSNRALLQSLLIADGFEPVAWPILPDDPARIGAALRDAAESFDVVFTCGGVSVGEKDFLPAWLEAQGRVHFWKVRMRPGMPVLAGQLGAAQFLCLPGNPVSVLATYLTLGRRLLDALQGRREPRALRHACLSAPVAKRHDRLEFLRGLLSCDPQGRWRVQPNPADGSHRLQAAAASDALIVLPEGAGDWPEGAVLQVLPLDRG
jgi:molybdopterin molybdotransferase